MSSSGNEDALAEASWRELSGDVKKAAGVSDLADEIANGEKLRNTQRGFIFVAVCILVAVSFIITVVLVVMIGRGVLMLSSSGQVAAIAAFGVQPFVLIGILTTNVYRGSAVELSDRARQSD